MANNPINTFTGNAVSGKQATSSHNIWVGLIGELIGVAALAVFADMNDNIGKLAMVLMIGWFILFLTINAPLLQSITKEV